MRRFLADLATHLLIVLVLTALVNSAYMALNRYPVEHTGKFAEVPASIQVANTGSSHGLYGFDYEALEGEGISCFNFALSAQSLEYDYRILEHYKDRIAPGGTVFVCVSHYFSLYGRGETHDEDFASLNRRYYRFLPDDLVREYDPVADFWATAIPSLDAGLSRLVEVFSGYYVSYDRRLKEGWVNGSADKIDLAEDVDSTYKNQIARRRNDDGSMTVNEEAVDALYKIIDLVRSLGAEPVLVSTPLIREFNDMVEKNLPGFYDDFYGRIDSIVSATGVRYYDYSHDERLVDDHGLFMDADHLNKRGAALFTAILVDEVLNS